MNFVSEFFYYFIFGALMLLCALGLWFTAIIPGIDRWNKRFFQSYFIVFILCFISAFLELLPRLFPVSVEAFYFILSLESLILSLPLPMLTVYLLHCSGESLRTSRLFHIVLGLLAVYMIPIVLNPFTGWFSYITPDMIYHRGPLYSFFLLPMIAILLLNFAGTMKRRKQLSQKTLTGLLIALLPMTASLFVQLFIDAFPFIDISLSPGRMPSLPEHESASTPVMTCFMQALLTKTLLIIL